MKKVFLYSWLASVFILFAWACNSKTALVAPIPSAGNGIVKAKDAAPITIIEQQSTSVTINDGIGVNCSSVVLDCSGNDTQTITTNIPMGSTLVSATLSSDNEQPSVEVNGSGFIEGAFSNVRGNVCTGLTFIAANGEEESNLVAYSSVVNKTGSNTIILSFSGCFADSFIYTYTTPVTVVETPTPVPSTPTAVPPTSTFTPVPPTPTPTTCGGSNCADAAPEVRQCNSIWANTLLAGGDSDNDTICSSGCLLTCLAMAGRTTPDKLNTILATGGDFNDSGELMMENVGKTEGILVDEVPSNAISDDELVAGLCTGIQVIAQVSHPGAHYVLVTGRKFDPVTDRCRVTVNDPNNTSISYLDDSSYQSVNEYVFLSSLPE